MYQLLKKINLESINWNSPCDETYNKAVKALAMESPMGVIASQNRIIILLLFIAFVLLLIVTAGLLNLFNIIFLLQLFNIIFPYVKQYTHT